MNPGSPQTFRHLQKHRPLIEVHVPSTRREAEECFRSEAGKCIILKVKFGAGFHTGANSEVRH